MANWDKSIFIDHLRKNCTREIAKIGVSIIEFSEKYADDIENAIISTAQKLDSLSAGKMGMSTSEVGDTVLNSILNN